VFPGIRDYQSINQSIGEARDACFPDEVHRAVGHRLRLGDEALRGPGGNRSAVGEATSTIGTPGEGGG
jgi:hypothetical protein